MKKILFIITCIVWFSSVAQQNSVNGGCFTPKGELKALVIFVGFKNKVVINNVQQNFNDQYFGGWDVKNGQDLPTYVDPISGEMELFHDNINDFRNGTEFNLSDYYHEMSFGKFKFTAETIKDTKTNKPVRIDIDYTGARTISQLNKKVIEEIDNRYPNFNWSKYDKHKNNPQYKFDASKTKPDGKPDFVILVYRYKKGFKKSPINKRMLGWGGAIASSFLGNNITLKNNKHISFDNMGYTASNSASAKPGNFFSTFVHEVAHKLYNAPHYNGANKAFGNYFYTPQTAYGMMNSENSMNRVANGWERWFVGWVNLLRKGNKENQSIDKFTNKPDTFYLDDYVTSGDVVRIPLPHTKNTFLWIENHQNISKFETGQYAGNVLSKENEQVPNPDSGCYVYIEAISPDRSHLPRYGNRKQTNALYLLNAQGNWDYVFNEDYIKSWDYYYNNPIFTFKRKEKNAISGHNNYMRFVHDFSIKKPKDGRIKYKKSSHGDKTESVFFMRETDGENTVMTYAGYGGVNHEAFWKLNRRSPMFQNGDEISLSGIVPVLSLPEYDFSNQLVKPRILNGLKLEFKELKDNRFRVVISYNDVKVNKNTIWKGNLEIVPNIVEVQSPSLILSKKKKLYLKKSGTVNSFKKQTDGSFITDTYLTIKTGSELRLEDKSSIIVEKGAHIVLEENATIKLNKNAKIIVEKGAAFTKHPNSFIFKSKGAKIIYL